MSKYYKAEDVIRAIEEMQNGYNGWSDTYDKAQIIGVLDELPTIEVSEDCISRKINAPRVVPMFEDCISKAYFEQEIENLCRTVDKDKEYWRGGNDALDKVVELIENAPSVVPKQVAGKLESVEISTLEEVESTMSQLKSKLAPTTEQSSIVRCKDCTHYHASKHYAYCTVINVKGKHPQPTDYCSYGERIEE